MKKRLFGILLSFALMLTIMPVLGLSQTAYADQAYSITTSVSEGGSVKVTVDGAEVTSADENKSVTLTAQPSDGCQLKSITAVSTLDVYEDFNADNATVKGNHFQVSGVKSDEGWQIYSDGSTDRAITISSLTGDDLSLVTLTVAGTAGGRVSTSLAVDHGEVRASGTAAGDAVTIDNINSPSVTLTAPNATESSQSWTFSKAMVLGSGKVAINLGDTGDPNVKTFIMPRGPVQGDAEFEKVYPLWVGGTQVTSKNASNITGGETVTASYNNDTKTLTLNGYDNEGRVGKKTAGIYAEENLIIETAGTNTVTSTEASARAIQVAGDLTFKGSGTLNATGGEYEGILAMNVTFNGGTVYATSNGVDSAIGAPGTVTINGGVVSATKKAGIGINAGQGVMITGGTVTAAGGGTSSAGIYSSNNGVTITGGTVIATGTGDNSAGVEAAGNNKVTISSGEVTATGRYVAIKGKVKNLIAGTGWTDTEGTEGKADISVSSEGQTLSYKNVQFPAKVDKVTVKFNSAGGSAVETQTIEKGAKATKPADPTRSGYTFDGWYLGDEEFDFDSPVENNITLTAHWTKNETPANMSTITFDLNGGTWEGMTGIVTMDVENGTVITLPAPTRDGYTFDYWEGSRYNAGDQYTVNGDHTFKAVWKTAAGGDGSKGDSKGGSSSGKKGVNTGDENTLGAWIVLLIAALTGTTGMAFARKRRND